MSIASLSIALGIGQKGLKNVGRHLWTFPSQDPNVN
jgi:hypothetical protein